MQRICVVEGCGGPHAARGWCNRHYSRWKRGVPIDAPAFERLRPGQRRGRIEAAAADAGPGSCDLLVEGGGRRSRYRIDGISHPASRAVWILANGDPGPDRWVLHTCANGMQGCIRLAHLYLGSAEDNSRDMIRDGNSGQGEKNPHAKLTARDVLAIRDRVAAGETQARLAEAYGVAPAAIGHIVTRRNWKHL